SASGSAICFCCSPSISQAGSTTPHSTSTAGAVSADHCPFGLSSGAPAWPVSGSIAGALAAAASASAISPSVDPTTPRDSTPGVAGADVAPAAESAPEPAEAAPELAFSVLKAPPAESALLPAPPPFLPPVDLPPISFP